MKRTKATLDARVRQASQARRDEEALQTRQRLLAAAGRVMLEMGYEHFSMRRVAEQAGYTATTIYRYFKDKDDLTLAILDAGFAEFGQRLARAAATPGTPVDRLTALAEAYVRFGLDHPVEFRVMFLQRPDLLSLSIEDKEARWFEGYRTLERAVAEAWPPPHTDAHRQLCTMTLWAHVHGIAALALCMPWVTPETAIAMARQSAHWVEVAHAAE